MGLNQSVLSYIPLYSIHNVQPFKIPKFCSFGSTGSYQLFMSKNVPIVTIPELTQENVVNALVTNTKLSEKMALEAWDSIKKEAEECAGYKGAFFYNPGGVSSNTLQTGFGLLLLRVEGYPAVYPAHYPADHPADYPADYSNSTYLNQKQIGIDNISVRVDDSVPFR